MLFRSAQGGLMFVMVPSTQVVGAGAQAGGEGAQAGGAGGAAENGASDADPGTEESTQVAGLFDTAQHNTLGYMNVFVVDGGVRMPRFAAAGMPDAGTEGQDPNRPRGVQVN